MWCAFSTLPSQVCFCLCCIVGYTEAWNGKDSTFKSFGPAGLSSLLVSKFQTSLYNENDRAQQSTAFQTPVSRTLAEPATHDLEDGFRVRPTPGAERDRDKHLSVRTHLSGTEASLLKGSFSVMWGLDFQSHIQKICLWEGPGWLGRLSL